MFNFVLSNTSLLFLGLELRVIYDRSSETRQLTQGGFLSQIFCLEDFLQIVKWLPRVLERHISQLIRLRHRLQVTNYGSVRSFWLTQVVALPAGCRE